MRHPQILLPLSMLPLAHRHEQSLRNIPVHPDKSLRMTHQDLHHGLLNNYWVVNQSYEYITAVRLEVEQNQLVGGVV
jgi:hypothetical protein